jgi:antitoxin HigA-1
MTKSLTPLHPGEVLREEFLEPLGLTAYRLAQECRTDRRRFERLEREDGRVTAETALMLAAYFRTTPEFWLNLQQRYDVETSRAKLAGKLQSIHPRELEPA